MCVLIQVETAAVAAELERQRISAAEAEAERRRIAFTLQKERIRLAAVLNSHLGPVCTVVVVVIAAVAAVVVAATAMVTVMGAMFPCRRKLPVHRWQWRPSPPLLRPSARPASQRA